MSARRESVRRDGGTSTDRWQVGLLVALLAGALGIVGQSTVLFMAGAVGLTFAAYGYATGEPPASFAVERELSDSNPTPGQPVTVTVTVRNTTDTVAPDVRIVDGVPSKLGVIEGSPRHGATLDRGAETSFSYVVRARRGRHTFEETVVVSRNTSGDERRRATVAVPTQLTVNADVGDVPLTDQTIPQTGMVPTDSGGNGVEFYQSRTYQRGDPVNRVDWNRYARTRELTTIEFREERAANVVVLVDVRDVARVARRADEPDAVVLSKFAAARIANGLLETGNRVGLAFFGSRGTYVEPGFGDDHGVAIRNVLETSTDTTFPVVTDGGRITGHGTGRVEWLRRRLPDSAQLYFVTPLLDATPVDSARRLQASGYDVRVLAPDVTSTESAGATVERIEWLERLSTVRGSGIEVEAWSPDEPLRAAFQRATRRWKR